MNSISYLRNAIPSWRALMAQRSERGIAILSTIWSHHAKRSGYHPVARGLGIILPGYGVRLLPAGISRWVVGHELDAAYQIALALKLARCDRLFVIDGDFQLQLIECLRRVTSAKIYAVFHQIPSILEQRLRGAFALLDGAVCVARCQIPLVQSIAPGGKTWFIPHGVDIDYFAPRPSVSDQVIVLCVGCHCRDFATLRGTADRIVRALPGTVARSVAPSSPAPG